MPTLTVGAFHRRNFVAGASEVKTVDNTAGGVALTSGTYGTRRYAVIVVETAPVRYLCGGGAPVAGTTGILLNPGDELELDSNEDIASFRAIRETSTNGKLQVIYSELKLTS